MFDVDENSGDMHCKREMQIDLTWILFAYHQVKSSALLIYNSICVSVAIVCVCVCIGVYYYCSWFIVGHLSFKNYKIRNTVLQVTALKVSP